MAASLGAGRPATLQNWLPVAGFTAVASIVASLAALTAKETYRTPLHELGRPL
jgi:hypothetical protein